MPLPIAEQTVDFFAALGIYSCIFIGGEPTLYRELPTLIRRAKASKIPEVTVVSNGRLFHRPAVVEDFLSAGLDVFSVTIHSAQRQVHDDITHVASWEETYHGIKNIVSLGGTCSLNIVAGPHNIETIPQSIAQFLKLGVKDIVVSCAVPTITQNGISGAQSLNPKRFAELVVALKDMPQQVTILHELPLCLIPRDTFLKLARTNRLGYGCHVGTGRGLSVDVDGTVIPCNSFPHLAIASLFANGQLQYTAEEFLEMWSQSETLTDLRKEANVMRSDICQGCDLWKLCNCGCPLTWGFYSPADFINPGLYGVGADEVQSWTEKNFNP